VIAYLIDKHLTLYADNLLTHRQTAVNSVCHKAVNNAVGGPPSPLPRMYVSAYGGVRMSRLRSFTIPLKNLQILRLQNVGEYDILL